MVLRRMNVESSVRVLLLGNYEPTVENSQKQWGLFFLDACDSDLDPNEA